jgi:hypothetical protein
VANAAESVQELELDLRGVSSSELASNATIITLTSADKLDENSFKEPLKVGGKYRAMCWNTYLCSIPCL